MGRHNFLNYARLAKQILNSTKEMIPYNNMNPVDDIKRGDIIQMTRTGKEFFVESITPLGVVLKECTRYVSFSKAALAERLKKKSSNTQKHLGNHESF